MTTTAKAYLLVAAGGALGAVCRMMVASMVQRIAPHAVFPWGTFLVNVTGSFLLGLVATLVIHRIFPQAEMVRLAVAVGFLGAYTTFSTFELEADALVTSGRWLPALLYVLGSVAAGFFALRLGVLLASR